MLNIGPQELILVLIIALVVVGPQRLPELGRSIGKALREFRKIQDDVKDTLRFDLSDDAPPYVAPHPDPVTGSNGGDTHEPGAAEASDPAPGPEPDPEPRATE